MLIILRLLLLTNPINTKIFLIFVRHRKILQSKNIFFVLRSDYPTHWPDFVVLVRQRLEETLNAQAQAHAQQQRQVDIFIFQYLSNSIYSFRIERASSSTTAQQITCKIHCVSHKSRLSSYFTIRQLQMQRIFSSCIVRRKCLIEVLFLSYIFDSKMKEEDSEIMSKTFLAHTFIWRRINLLESTICL
jgi:hypothetical protein